MIPKIDPDVKYIGSSKLRGLTAIELRALTGAIVVTGAQNTPLAVILPYETYLKMQAAISDGEKIVEAGFVGAQQGDVDIHLLRSGLRQKGDKTR